MYDKYLSLEFKFQHNSPRANLILPFFNLCGGTLGNSAISGLLYQPRMIGEGNCEKIGGMKIGRGTEVL
jgi:hypothetical protein